MKHSERVIKITSLLIENIVFGLWFNFNINSLCCIFSVSCNDNYAIIYAKLIGYEL